MPSTMFRIHMLPANHGDCLWVEYGDPAAPHRVLIDGGPAGAWSHLRPRLEALPASDRRFELVVCTHVDADHIAGVLKLLGGPVADVRCDDVWFNGFRHLVGGLSYGPVQGEALTDMLATRPWNVAFGGDAITVPDEGPLLTTTLPGGMKLTVLSPTMGKLRALAPAWRKACVAAGLDPDEPAPEAVSVPSFATPTALDIEAAAGAPFREDGAEANGSSIALLAEYDGRRVLFGADAHASVLIEAIDRLCPDGGRLRVDAFKLPHHGSQNNVSRALLGRVDCPRFLVSTNGDIFGHPDAEALARVVLDAGGTPELIFNYRSAHNTMWDDPNLQQKHGYTVRYPQDGQRGLVVDV